MYLSVKSFLVSLRISNFRVHNLIFKIHHGKCFSRPKIIPVRFLYFICDTGTKSNTLTEKIKIHALSTMVCFYICFFTHFVRFMLILLYMHSFSRERESEAFVHRCAQGPSLSNLVCNWHHNHQDKKIEPESKNWHHLCRKSRGSSTGPAQLISAILRPTIVVGRSSEAFKNHRFVNGHWFLKIAERAPRLTGSSH